MKLLFVLKLIAILSINCFGQAEAKQVVDEFFVGLNSKDTSVIRSTLYVDIELATVVDGSRPVKVESVDRFLESVEKSHGMDLEERISSYEVMMDEGMVIVWAPYQFFVNDQLSHCGVNAFTLILTDQGWKIHRIIDTRRKENCHTVE